MPSSKVERVGAAPIIRVALVDDHRLFRDALRIMLEHDPRIEVVCEAGDGLAAVHDVIESGAEVVCMDIGLPGMNGIETTRQLLAINPALKVVGLSADFDRSHVLDLLKVGASGYVAKTACGDELLRAIHTMRRGHKYLCPEVNDAVAGGVLDKYIDTATAPPLSKRERQVLQLVAEGHTSPQIAKLLFIATSTTEAHRRNILRKLNIRRIADLTKYAIRSGLTTSERSLGLIPCL